jgi:hypothetical protein
MASTVLNFTISANTSSAEAGVNRLGASFDKAGGAAASMSKAFEVTDSNAARVAKSLGLELSSGAERAVSKLEALRDHLTRTGAPAADLEKTTLALAEADKKYAASLSNTVQQMGVWQQHGTAMAATAGVMATALLSYGVIAVKAFSESEAVLADLDAVLESTGDTSAETKEQILGLAQSLQKVTAFSDETIIRGETILKMFTHIGADVFPRATKATLDLAQRMGMDVPQAAKLLGKALDQPGEGFTALAKATGKFTDAQVDTIKEMVAFGETSKAQAMVLDLVEKKVGGSAEAFGKTLPGSIAIAKNSADEFNESMGGKLTPTIKGLIQEFPNLTAVIVGGKSAWDGMNISGGELLIAIPLLKTAFAGMGASLTGMFAASGPIALGIIGFTALAGTIYAAVKAGQALNEWQRSATQANQDAMRATDALTKNAKEYGIVLQKGNETQEQFNAKLFQSIAAYEKLHPEVKKAEVATIQHTAKIASHVITLQEQIDKQRALVESLSHQVGKDKELTEATDKLNQLLQKQGEGAKKTAEAHKQLAKEIESLSNNSLTGLAKEIASIETKWKSITSNKDITPFLAKQATDAANLAVNLAVTAHALKIVEDAYKDLGKVAEEFEKSRLKNLDILSDEYSKTLGKQIQEDKKTSAAIDKVWDESYKARGAARLAAAVNEREKIIIQYQLDLDAFRNSEEGKMLLIQARDTYDEKVASLQVKRDADLAAESTKSAEKMSDVWSKQVSTIVTDLGKGLSDALIHWKGFGEALKKTAQEFGTFTSRIIFESMLDPLTKPGGLFDRLGDKLSEIFDSVIKKVQSWFSDLFDSIQDFLGTKLGKILGALTGAGIALAGYKQGSKVMGAAGGALMGAELGSFAGPWGTAIGAGLGAVGGWIAGAFGARGQAKTAATGGAETLSENVWKGIIPDVQAGRMSVDEGLKALNTAWDNYVKFLNETVKDQTVIQRSIDTQRVTLTEGTAALENLRKTLDDVAKAEALKKATENLKTLGAQFIETGKMSDEFAKAVEGAGGSVSFFNRMAGEVERLQGLRNEFSSLKKMIDSLVPAIKTWQQVFFETGEITAEMAAKIREAGGDIEAFKKFAEMRQVKNEFASLVEEFENTGVASARLIDLLKQFASPELFEKFMQSLGNTSEVIQKEIKATFDSTAGGIKKLIDSFELLNNEWEKSKTVSDEAVRMIRKFADPTTLAAFEKLIAESAKTGKSLSQLGLESKDAASVLSKAFSSASENIKNLQQDFKILKGNFEETGEVSDKFLKILEEYSDPETFSAFKDLIALAKESGVTILDLAKDSTVAADIIKKVFGSAAANIDKAFTNAAKDLQTTLAKMDENLGKAIASLQAAMVTMIKDLIDVLLDVPGAAEKAARDANFFLGTIKDREVRINFTATGLDEIQRRADTFGGINTPATNPTIDSGTVTSGGSRGSRDSYYTPQYASGTDYVPRTGLAMVHQGEAIIPAGGGWSGKTVNVYIEKVVTDDPEAMMEAVTRMADTNQNGSRVKLLKAMRLRETGAF